MIDAVDLAFRGGLRQLADGPPTATTNVENGVTVLDGNVAQRPISQLGMTRVHAKQHESPKPS
jgi:hypothetical protein